MPMALRLWHLQPVLALRAHHVRDQEGQGSTKEVSGSATLIRPHCSSGSCSAAVPGGGSKFRPLNCGRPGRTHCRPCVSQATRNDTRRTRSQPDARAAVHTRHMHKMMGVDCIGAGGCFVGLVGSEANRKFEDLKAPPPPAHNQNTFRPTEGQNEQWREANRRRQRQTIRYRGLVPTPPPPAPPGVTKQWPDWGAPTMWYPSKRWT